MKESIKGIKAQIERIVNESFAEAKTLPDLDSRRDATDRLLVDGIQAMEENPLIWMSAEIEEVTRFANAALVRGYEVRLMAIRKSLRDNWRF